MFVLSPCTPTEEDIVGFDPRVGRDEIDESLAAERGQGAGAPRFAPLDRRNPPVRCVGPSRLLIPLTQKQQESSIRRPDGIAGGRELGVPGLRLAALGPHQVDPFERARIAARARPESDPASIRRKAWTAAVSRQLTGFATQRGHHINAAAVPIGSEHEAAAIRREARLPIVGGAPRQADRFAARDLADPEVERALTITIRGVGEQRSVSRQRRKRREPGVRRDPSQDARIVGVRPAGTPTIASRQRRESPW